MFEKLKKNLELLKEQSPHKKPVVCVFAGTFNPVHKKHIANFEIAKRHIESQDSSKKVVGGFICPHSDQQMQRDKKLPRENIIGVKRRVEMLKLATEDSDWIDVDEWEWKYEEAFPDYPRGLIQASENISDSLNAGWTKLGKEIKQYGFGNIEVAPLCGDDTALKFSKYFDLMIDRGFRTIVISRYKKNGWQKKVEDALNNAHGDKWKGFVSFADSDDEIEKSGSNIKDLLKKGDYEGLKEMLHPKVLEYAKKKKNLFGERERQNQFKPLTTTQYLLDSRRRSYYCNFTFGNFFSDISEKKKEIISF